MKNTIKGNEEKNSGGVGTESPRPAPEKQFKVIGPNTTNGQLSMWHYPSLESANGFAEFLATETHAKVMVCELIGTWQIKRAPVEYLAASETLPAPKPETEIPGAFVPGQGHK